MFQTVGSRPAKDDRTNGEGCMRACYTYVTLGIPGFCKKTREKVVEKRKKSRCGRTNA